MEPQLVFVPGTHQYFLDGEEIPSLSSIIWGPKSDADFAPGAAERGNRIHRCLELADKGKLSPLYREQIRGLMMEKFLEEWERLAFDCVLIEEPVWGEIDGLRWGTTPDRVVVQNGLVNLDIKTGSPVPKIHGMQCYAQKVAIEQRRGWVIESTGAIYLKESKGAVTSTVREYNEPEHEGHFRERLRQWYERAAA